MDGYVGVGLLQRCHSLRGSQDAEEADIDSSPAAQQVECGLRGLLERGDEAGLGHLDRLRQHPGGSY